MNKQVASDGMGDAIAAVKGGRFIITIGVSAIVGAVVSLAIGAFNLGDAWRAAQATMDKSNIRIASLEKNYDALYARVGLLDSVVQDEKRFNDQIANIQSQMIGLTQNLQGATQSIAGLAVEMSRIREAAGRTDERVILLDEIIKGERMKKVP